METLPDGLLLHCLCTYESMLMLLRVRNSYRCLFERNRVRIIDSHTNWNIGKTSYLYVFKGELHREGDEPAVLGGYSEQWYRHGKRHRGQDRPAVVYKQADPSSSLLASEYKYRDGGIWNMEYMSPVAKSGGRAWYIDGRLHRGQDRPAVVKNNGDKEWYWKGKRHRENNKPAIVIAGEMYKGQGTKQYWLNGKRYFLYDVKGCAKGTAGW